MAPLSHFDDYDQADRAVACSARRRLSSNLMKDV
jgi:hypothetical protein